VPAIKAVALEGLPEIHVNDDLAQLIADAMPAGAPVAGDVLVLAHKAVSKAEGATRRLSAVRPSERALELGARLDKDPRHVQVVLDESREIRRAENGVLIAVTHHGFVCANAGVDASNAPDDDTLILLPRAPDSSARALRARLGELLGNSPAVLITDSFGRAWRHGQIDVGLFAVGHVRNHGFVRRVVDLEGRAVLSILPAAVDQRLTRLTNEALDRCAQRHHIDSGIHLVISCCNHPCVGPGRALRSVRFEPAVPAGGPIIGRLK